MFILIYLFDFFFILHHSTYCTFSRSCYYSVRLARTAIISIHTLLIPPYLSIRTHCTRYLTVYVHAHVSLLYSTLHFYCCYSSTTLPTKCLSSTLEIDFPPPLSLFPTYYTIKQKLCNPFLPFFSFHNVPTTTATTKKPIPDRQDFPFFFSFFLHFHRFLICALSPNHTISRSRFFPPFQKYYVPFFF
ncbi:hypothetical protein HOY82DRAFT_82921 [Tuber indicum]|nr:hypothetical protein HOY82DRAFT_82921 [Tuber indicum]